MEGLQIPIQSGPLVSCILPTKNRAAYVPTAIRCYQSQTYLRKELIIVDNGDDATSSVIPTDDSTIRYVRVTSPLPTGSMRNLCTQHAKGEYICHFDSDDWSAPTRVADQVARLRDTHGVVTGYHSMLFYDERTEQCYEWQGPVPIRYVLGTSLCYRRDWWYHHPFLPVQVGEDTRFFQQARKEAYQLVVTAPADHLMVARIHDDQTCKKTLNPRSYTRVPPTKLPRGFLDAL